MPDLNFDITVGRSKPKDYKAISDGMLLYHAKKRHRRVSEVINTFSKIKINVDFVEKSLRDHGYDRKLMEVSENEGKIIRICSELYHILISPF